MGETIVNTPATLIELDLTVTGDVPSFDASAQASLAASVRTTLNCYQPDCYVTLRLSAGSVVVAVLLTIPHATPTPSSPGGGSPGGGGSGSAAVANSVAAAANALVAQPASTISASLGVAVESASPTIDVGTAVVPLVVAPPPPSPPPPPLSPPPTQAPTATDPPKDSSSTQPSPPSSDLVITTEAVVAGQQTDDSGGDMTLIIAAVGGGCGVLVVTIAICGVLKRRKRRAKPPATVAVQASTVDITKHDFELASASASDIAVEMPELDSPRIEMPPKFEDINVASTSADDVTVAMPGSEYDE